MTVAHEYFRIMTFTIFNRCQLFRDLVRFTDPTDRGVFSSSVFLCKSSCLIRLQSGLIYHLSLSLIKLSSCFPRYMNDSLSVSAEHVDRLSNACFLFWKFDNILLTFWDETKLFWGLRRGSGNIIMSQKNFSVRNFYYIGARQVIVAGGQSSALYSKCEGETIDRVQRWTIRQLTKVKPSEGILGTLLKGFMFSISLKFNHVIS